MVQVLERIRKLLTAPPTVAPGGDDLHIAVAVLLVEAARMDDVFSAPERATIARVLSGKFGLTAAETGEVLATAEAMAAKTHQIHPFTRLAVSRMAREDRLRLIEMLWEVVYADGILDADEDHLLRRVAGLIHISDADRIAARQRVLARSPPRNTQ